MPVDKGDGGREQRPPDEWERIDLEQAARDRAQRKYDEPGEVWEQSARPLPEGYGADRPASRTVQPDQAAEMVELWGQEQFDKLVASGRIVVEGAEEPRLDEGDTGGPGGSGDQNDRPRAEEDQAADYHPELADRVPIRPDRPGAKTHGLLASADGAAVWDAPLPSGRDGPAAEIGGAASLRLPSGLVIETHVEAHAAAEMRRHNLDDGVLYINRDPCEGPYSCDEWLPAMLPADAKLTVYGPDRTARIYYGVEDE